MSILPTQEKADEITARLYPAGIDRAAIAARLTRFIQGEGDILPAAGSALGGLGRELYREDAHLDRCTRVIETDAGLSHAVLRAANLAALGSRTFTVPYAVMFLGIVRLRIVFGIEVLRRMNTERLLGAWTPFWQRNLFTARLVDKLASRYHPVDGTEHLAGLLHDAAWPLLVTFFKREYGVLFESPANLFPLEREVFGTPHAAVSAALCLRSGLPRHVIDAVARHHATGLPDRADVPTPRYNGAFLGVLLRVADGLADALGFPAHGIVSGPKLVEEVVHSPEAAWLASFGPLPDLETLARDELRQVVQVWGLFRPE